MYLEKQKENRDVQKQAVLRSQPKRAGLARRIATEKLMLAAKSITEVHFEVGQQSVQERFWNTD